MLDDYHEYHEKGRRGAWGGDVFLEFRKSGKMKRRDGWQQREPIGFVYKKRSWS
jgi:hypothetical protein